ncbi:hypothetical protein AVEN_159389-1 [Araneus ventricosus]|uniref:Uncharacterized protein n=1 Tax=Araneus ventricosus TaxID=182803 RepID=A0A4Y2A268_ARAVE|nr:hypothetical protein AVEN_159389-1 [Araneus ventricosus]
MSLLLASESVKSLVNQDSAQLADLVYSPSSGRQRSPTISSVQPISSSNLSATSSRPLILKDAPIQELFQNLKNIINGGTTTATKGGKSKYK